ncbi:uncharacterized protein LOC116176097 isoform X1 [Photinus pyralis]|uniref:uncharacterized protein LOC116176097 isoform X1 n=1 Tax=Photinus pyralis TaxID=7054 RepID=UPI001266EA7A|nr:uncharacterized protein LOC116176097 isoform X1 [Photinus pyralis]
MLNNECQKLGPESFFEMLIRAVNKNSSESSSANRYPDELKNLCLYLFLTSGRLAYETLVANIPNGLPSVSTLSRSLSKNYEKCGEGELAFGQLKEFLEKRNYPLRIFISEDQTAIVRRPRYDQSTNQLVGYVLTNLEHTGFPKTNQNLINSVSNIKNIIENSDLAKNAYVFMAQPLQDGAAAFCLTLFGSNNTFTHEDVLLRWKYIQQETTNYNIVVDGISSDGDSRCLKAMKIIAGLPAFSKQETPYSPYFQANFDINNLVPMQDTVHIATKMKNRLLNEKIVLKMGNYEVSKDHLTDLINTVSKDKHLLCLSYLDSSDKMNFEAIDKLSSTRVISLLTSDVCKATRQLLVLTRYILDSYLDKSLSIEERVYLIWYVTLFLRLWRAWIKEQSNYTLAKNWLTLNTYTCIELNAHGYMILIEKFRSNPEFVLPWIYSSQPCEKFFRQTRSMTSTWSTVVNFDMLDLLRRRHRIQAINSIINDSGDKFVFPRERNKKLGANLRNKETFIPPTEELRNVIIKARDDAVNDCKILGIDMLENQWEAALTEVSIPKQDDSDHTDSNFLLQSNVTSTALQDEAEQLSETQLTANEEDIQDINKDEEILQNFTSLDIKDLSGCKTDISDISLIKIKINDKEMVVKKSTLCWLFFKRKGRLSSDRLIRCKAMSGPTSSSKKRTSGINQKIGKKCVNNRVKNTENLKTQKTQQKKKSENISDSETSVSDSLSVHSEFENETFSEDDDSEISSEVSNISRNISIQQEAYYAVCYESWYIGRIIKVVDNAKSEIKFLKLELDKYVWPREDDKQIVNNKFIFYGPVSLMGNGPFHLRRNEKIKIEQIFKTIKKELKEFL